MANSLFFCLFITSTHSCVDYALRWHHTGDNRLSSSDTLMQKPIPGNTITHRPRHDGFQTVWTFLILVKMTHKLTTVLAFPIRFLWSTQSENSETRVGTQPSLWTSSPKFPSHLVLKDPAWSHPCLGGSFLLRHSPSCQLWASWIPAALSCPIPLKSLFCVLFIKRLVIP